MIEQVQNHVRMRYSVLLTNNYKYKYEKHRIIANKTTRQ